MLGRTFHGWLLTLALLPHLLLGAGFESAVWCVADDGHAAIEFDPRVCPTESVEVAAMATTDGGCTDTSLTLLDITPQSGRVALSLPPARLLPVRLDDLAADRRPLPAPFWEQSAPTTLASLRTVYLLI